jgi:hypothetical protein
MAEGTLLILITDAQWEVAEFTPQSLTPLSINHASGSFFAL